MSNRDEDLEDYEGICFVCNRPESVTKSMLKLPNGICICGDCMQTAMNTFDSMPDITKEGFKNFTIPGSEDDSNNKKINSDESSENPDKKDGDKDENDDKKGTPIGSIFNLGSFPGFMSFGDMPQSKKLKKRKTDKKKEYKPLSDLKDLPAPHIIKKKLDEYVVGQEKAKKVMSVAVYNHYKRILAEEARIEKENSEAEDSKDIKNESENIEETSVEIEKSNMLLVGPTGCGKTFLVKTLARILRVPLAITDATTLTEAGYIGDDVESVLSKLLSAADNDVDMAEKGIVFIDEIDKISKKRNTNSRDVSGESVQQGLLKLLEGSEVEVPVGSTSKNAMVPMTTIDTTNILFILGGAFPELDKNIKARLTKQSQIGFKSELKDKYDDDNIQLQVTVEDLREFGMIPEFLGRIPIICPLESMTVPMLKKILTDPKNAILKQYEKLLSYDEVKLVFDDSAVEAIAEKAVEKKTGARALRAIIEEFMLDIMYEIPKDDMIGQVTINRDYIEGKGSPVIAMRGE